MNKDKDNLNRLYADVPNSIRIDSLKLRIPLSLISLKDTSVLNHYIEVNESTGEFNPEEYKLKFKEYLFTTTSKVKIGIERRNTFQGGNEECLMIYLNSKILRERYFQGLHFDLIKDVYSDLISLNIFDLDFDTFVRSECTDIDFKFDEVMNQDTWNSLLDEFMRLTLQSAELDKGYKRFKPTKQEPLNNGLQYNKRATATPSRPFLKLYWKGGELLSNSLDYYNEHLKHEANEYQVKQIVRIETTIKNKEHAKKLGIESTTLLSLLSLTEAEKETMFRKIISKHLVKPNRDIKVERAKDKDKMNPTEQIFYVAIMSLMKTSNMTSTEAIETLLQTIEDKSAKSKKRTALKQIYKAHIQGNKVDISVEKMNSFFTKFGWV